MPSAFDTEAEPAIPPEIQAACEPFLVVGQNVELDINFRDKSVSGISTLLIFPLLNELEEISIDARQCDIDTENIYVDGVKTKAWYKDPYDLLSIPEQWQLGASQHQIMRHRMAPLLPERRPDVPISQRERLMEHSLGCVPFEGSLKISLRPGDLAKEEPRPLKITRKRQTPEEEKVGIKISIPFRTERIRDGLHFVGIEEGDTRYPHVYTRHSIEPGMAPCIFPCIDDPGQRHQFTVAIKCPRTLGDALEQPLATQQTGGQVVNGNRKRKHGEASPQRPQTVLIEEDKLLEMTVVCSGNLTGDHVDPDDERKKIMRFECHNTSPRHIGFAVGPFEHVALWSEFRTEESDEKLGANAAKIHGYCLPGRADEVRNTCSPIVAAADYFALEFGKYPFDSFKLCFIEDQIADTVETTSLSLCSSRLLYPYDIIDTEIDVTRKLVHSLATQYLGVHIVPNQRSDRWLVVGIQWYMTDLFMRTLCGTNWYKFHLKTMSDKLVKADVGRPSLHDLGGYLHVGDFESDFLALKAPLVLYILDQRMSKYPGSTGVARVLSHIVSTANISNTDAKATSVSADDFLKSCEKKSPYRPEIFWQQWIYRSGCPKLLVKQKFNKKNLNVDIIIVQLQSDPSQTRLSKEDFWKEFQEEIYHVYASEVEKVFTGPMTIRIHEADGTPYEHYLDIREDDKKQTIWTIPYNTKYKRMKRKGRQKDMTAAATAANADGKGDVPEDDVVYFNMLGDVLSSTTDMDNWGLKDWPESVLAAMEGESYEWIRFDCNFEWCCEISTDMPGYMYLAQLQQDRDVVAHQDAMLFWTKAGRHPVASSIEARTLYDRRYYHGIRAQAVADLPKQAVPEQNYIGMAHLILAFRHFFCYRVLGGSGNETWPPAPNDFSDKAQYAIQSVMPGAIAKIRGEKGRCPKSARSFLLDLLLFNDNSENEYSDQFYVANLLKAITTSLVNEKYDEDRELIYTLSSYDDDDIEYKQFIERTMEEIDRYRRMDEWTSSYQNVWTTTALECKMLLMKARVIPTAPLDFLQYLPDDNLDLVRVKAFECLVELGMISKPAILKLMLSIMSTDSSPFVRDRLFKAFCRGIASIAFDENKAVEKPAAPPELEDGDLIIEQGDAITEARKAKQARLEDINAALAGLKEDVKGNKDLQIGLWKAFESTALGLEEKRQILELCQAAFEPEDALLVTVKYPRVWTVSRAPVPKVNGSADKSAKKKCIIQFTSVYRTTPRQPGPGELALPVVEASKPVEPVKIKLQSKPSSVSAQGASTSVVIPPLIRQPSISVALPKPASDSIAVSPVRVRPATPAMSPAPSQRSTSQQPNGVKQAEKRPKPAKKRKSDEEENNSRPKKVVKTEAAAANGRRRIVTVKFTKWDRLRADVRAKIEAERSSKEGSASTIVATPRKPSVVLANPGARRPSASGSSTPAPSASSVHSASGAGSSKPRKPLPSAAPPQAATPAAASTPSATPAPPPSASAEPAAAPKRTVIKLKLPSLKGPSS